MFRPEHEEIWDRTKRTLNAKSIKMYNNPQYALALEEYITEEEENRRNIIDGINKNIRRIETKL